MHKGCTAVKVLTYFVAQGVRSYEGLDIFCCMWARIYQCASVFTVLSPMFCFASERGKVDDTEPQTRAKISTKCLHTIFLVVFHMVVSYAVFVMMSSSVTGVVGIFTQKN